MRRRELRGFATSMAQKFGASADHFAFLALEHRLEVVNIDLLSQEIEPAIFDIDRNRNLVSMVATNLAAIMERTKPIELQRATLLAVFGMETHVHRGWPCTTARFDVRLTDETFKTWLGTCFEPNMLVQQ